MEETRKAPHKSATSGLIRLMPYPMKIQPIDFDAPEEPHPKYETAVKPVFKSRFMRLFEKPFSRDKSAGATLLPHNCNKDGVEEFEPSSVCLAKMVQNFIEESNEKQQRCGKNRCNCFHGKCTGGSDEELDSYNSSFAHAYDVLKSLAPCLCVSERNLLADTAKIVERNKITKRKDGVCRKIVADGLVALGYNASICKSKWEKSPSFPAGEYEYVDVIIEGERLIIDIDFRSEFEIARSTKAYKLVLQTLPNIFIGKADRLEKIIAVVSEAAKQSLKKKGMPFPPWRKPEYVKAKWLSPFTRLGPCQIPSSSPCNNDIETKPTGERESALIPMTILGEKCAPLEKTNNDDGVFVFSNSSSSPREDDGFKSVKKWEPPEVKPKSVNKGVKIVTGLASVIEPKP
ncbi:uncharacterized protein LOC105163323 [Sesamum indicum]|uniref:Uncharacterized protein LOC105163323 n=1 Tax=Sesamum indicum TaxID=4182 RepID=A0A6I9T6Z0_SESIN|nr:uncharacterized protein LOC105163323 [Sesamum indicum]